MNSRRRIALLAALELMNEADEILQSVERRQP
jgi:hypothetical protein